MYCVSILVPIYNVEDSIERCLISLFEQTFESIEYIFVNDASQDRSIDILSKTLEKYPQRKSATKIVTHTQNSGLAVARKTAVENATSEYIIHVDSDDYIDLDMISQMYKEAKNNDADIVLSDMIFEYPNYNHKVVEKFTNKDQYLKNQLTRRAMFTLCGKLIRRRIIIENEIYALPGINYGEDYQVTPRIVFYSKVISKSQTSYHYDQTNPNSYTNTISHKGISDIIESQKYLNYFFEKHEEVIGKDVIEESCIMTIISLLSISSLDEYKFIKNSFKKIHYKNFNIRFAYKILLFLMDHKMYGLSYIIVSLYKCLFHRKRR